MTCCYVVLNGHPARTHATAPTTPYANHVGCRFSLRQAAGLKTFASPRGADANVVYSTMQPLPFRLGFFTAGGSSAATIAWSSLANSSEFSVGNKTHLIKHILKLELRQRRALHVLDRTQLLGHLLAVLFPHRLHLLLRQLLPNLRIVS